MITRRLMLPVLAASLTPGAAGQEGGLHESDFSQVNGLLVPVAQFFVRNHFALPRLTRGSWRVRLAGSVRSPLQLGYADLARMPAREVVATLECAGNRVGGGGVGTAAWRGVPLCALLERAGLLPGVRYIRLVGADSGRMSGSSVAVPYARSIPLEKALDRDTLVAYQMNGQLLPEALGHPARVLVPGWYGMDWVKWPVRIEALTDEDQSFFMSQRYKRVRAEAIGSQRFPVRALQMKSQIAWPRDGEVLDGRSFVIRGAAWAGEASVASVEVSLDGGKRWTEAVIQRHGHRYAWMLWSMSGVAEPERELMLMVRATDGGGNTQPFERDARRLDAYELNWVQTVRCETARSN